MNKKLINNMDLKDEIKKDLCQQYALNENHRQTMIFSFLTILVGVTSAYGISMKNYINEPKLQTLFIFCTASSFSFIFFIVPIIVSIINGYALRRDQLVVDKIRKMVFKKNKDDEIIKTKSEYEYLFSFYNPQKSCCSFLQDFNIAVIRISIILQILFLTSSILTIIFVSFCINNAHNYFEFCYSNCFILLLIFSFILTICTELIIFVIYANKFSKIKRK